MTKPKVIQKEYRTVEANNHLDLDDAVNRLIGMGWEPLGSPSAFCFNATGLHFVYIQAMIINSEEGEK